MVNGLQVFYSNCVENLFEEFKNDVFQQSCSVFDKRIVIVPNQAVKSWLMIQLAKDPILTIGMGIEVNYLNQSIDSIRTLLDPNLEKVPTQFELAISIQIQIQRQIAHFKLNSLSITWKPLFDYLGVNSDSISKKSEKRLVSLSEKLAKLFLDYGKFGEKMVSKWNLNPTKNWQMQLWKLISNQYQLIPPTFQNELRPKTFPKVFVFCLSYIPKYHFDYLENLGKHTDVNFYILSPCQAFWSDICSDKEARAIQKYWAKLKASLLQQVSLENFLRDRNPLLANFGRLGRHMANQIEESAALIREQYVLPQGSQNYPEYVDLTDENIQIQVSKGCSLTVLEAVKSDVVLLRNPQNQIQLENSDDSIQIHEAISPMREMQVLYDTLMELIAKNNLSQCPLLPEDILVMATDISKYEPYIKYVFGASESQFKVQIMDLENAGKGPIVQAFLHLIDLSLGRWDASALITLLEFDSFQKKHNFSSEDVLTISSWIKEAGVRWGIDLSHRNEILKRAYCDGEMLDSSQTGTWAKGLSRILLGLVMHVPKEVVNGGINTIPLEILDNTQGNLLGQWIQLLKSLHDDLGCIVDGSLFTLSEWSLYLESLCRTYLAGPAQDFDLLFDCIGKFRFLNSETNEAKFSFITVKSHLLTMLKESNVNFHENHLHTIRFCSMLPMRTVPARVVALIGMEEGSFPKQEVNFSLNLMMGNPDVDYFPSITDFDRYLFLEALISARDYFIMSYCTSSNGEEKGPSLLVTELTSYLDNNYRIGTEIPSKKIIKKHSFYPFDKSLFMDGSENQSYSPFFFKVAKAYYSNKVASHRFIPTFINKLSSESKVELCIDIKDLQAFAKNPIKIFFNKTLGIYLDDDEKRIMKTEEDFKLSLLHKSKLRKDAVRGSLTKVIKRADMEGLLPIGPFKNIELVKFSKEIHSINNNLDLAGIDPEDMFDIILASNHLEVCEENGILKMPPVFIILENSVRIKLIGQINDVSNQGLVIHEEGENTDILKHWPTYLIMAYVIKSHSLDIENKMFFSKNSKEFSLKIDGIESILSRYLEYYLSSLKMASPLIIEWIPTLVNQPESLEKKLSEHLGQSDYNYFYNNYMKWSLAGLTQANSSVISKEWHTTASHIFKELFIQSKKEKVYEEL